MELFKYALNPNTSSAGPGGTTTPVSGLTLTSIAGTAVGDTKVTVTPTLTSGNSYKYKTGATLTIPNVGDTIAQGYSVWDGTSDISAKTGDKILIVEVDSANKAVKGGQATVTSKA